MACRYINHSCAPNCVAEVVTFERGHKIIISSNRRIQKGEEVSMWDPRAPLVAAVQLAAWRGRLARGLSRASALEKVSLWWVRGRHPSLHPGHSRVAFLLVAALKVWTTGPPTSLPLCSPNSNPRSTHRHHVPVSSGSCRTLGPRPTGPSLQRFCLSSH